MVNECFEFLNIETAFGICNVEHLHKVGGINREFIRIRVAFPKPVELTGVHASVAVEVMDLPE